MYEIIHFDKMLCRLLRNQFNVISDDCDIYSIWHFCPNARWSSFKSLLSISPLCSAEWFPVVYWMVLVISILGSLYSLYEFTTLYWGCRKHVSIWRQRKYYVLPYTLLRKCRLIGSLVMLNAWLLLWYAVMNVSPAHMSPWITINMCVLSFELITYSIEILVGAAKMDLQHVLTFILPIANFLFVRCVRTVFTRAIETNDVDDLRLWKHTFK